MSTYIAIPDMVPSEFRATFHPDYPYDDRYRWDNVILESSEGQRFHFSRQALIDDSTVFADASILASDTDTLQPIVFTFAPTLGLHYFLMLLRQPPRPASRPNEEPEPLVVTDDTTADTIRIAHILDSPAVGRAMLHQGGLDVYLRYAIERSFEEMNASSGKVKHPSTRIRDPDDISFSLNFSERYRRSLKLLQEVKPEVITSLVMFHHRRSRAISAVQQWWSTGIPVGRVLRSDRPPQRDHDQTCRRRLFSGGAFAKELPEIANLALATLAKSKTKTERAGKVRLVLASQAHRCKGCFARLEAVYMPALRRFDADFPNVPK